MTITSHHDVLAHSTSHARINAPSSHVDIGSWLLALPDSEYQRCAPSEHIAAGATVTDDGRPMSINVEKVGDALIVQHFVGEVVDRLHAKMVSLSDVFTADGTHTNVHVTWELTAHPDDDGLLLVNDAVIRPTEDFLTYLDRTGTTLARAITDQSEASARHNAVETPLFAASIERAALDAAATHPR